jgi:exodeoxyribonuclease VII small subunit
MTNTTFKDAYGVLQRHADTLRNQREPNIDDLLTIVTQSVDAYKVCKERIDAVEKALEKALADTNTASRENTRQTGARVPPAPVDPDNGDIPF